MSTTITRGNVVITPTAVTSVRSERESRNVVHSIIGRDADDVTLRPAGLRTGTLELVWHSTNTAETDSEAAELAHAEGGVFTIVAPERASLSFTYVTDQSGRITRELNAELGSWTVRIDYREVRS